MKLILCIDAGGVKPLMIAATLLERLGRETGAQVQDFVDMFVGTSGGSIAAALFATGHTPKQVRELAHQLGKSAFSRSWWHRVKSLNGLYGPKYEIAKLHQTARDVFGDARLNSIEKPCIFPTTDIRTNDAVFLKSHAGNFAGLPIAEAVTASSAAPFYFEPWRGVFYDGGLHSFSPILVALGEATVMWKWEEDVTILSIGSGQQEPIKTTRNPVKLAESLVGGTLASNTDSDHWLAGVFGETRLGKTRVYRFQPRIRTAMDAVDMGTLSRLHSAAHHCINTNSEEWFSLQDTMHEILGAA